MSVANRLKNSWRITLLAGAFLFAQFTVAAQGCMPSHERPAGTGEQTMAQEGCDALPMDAAVCQAHCLDQDQTASSLEKHFSAVPAPAVRVSFAPPAMRSASLPRDALPPAGRALQILYCSYQI